MRIGITGSPATGKKTVAFELANLTGLQVVLLNEIAIRNRLGKKIGGEFVVDISRLAKSEIVRNGTIVVGHLLPYVIPASDLDFVAILRCSPEALRRRYIKRGYSTSKIEENVSSELLDIVSFSSLQKYGLRKVAEFDTTRMRSARYLAGKILLTIEGKRPKRYGIFNWSARAGRSQRCLLKAIRG